MTQRRQHTKGFTLIELLFGVLVLLLAIGGLLGAFMGLSVLNTTAKQQTLAVHDANRRMEELRNMTFAALPSLTTTTVTWSNELAQQGGQIVTIPQTISGSLRRMTVQVNWQHRGRPRQVQLVSLFTDRSR